MNSINSAKHYCFIMLKILSSLVINTQYIQNILFLCLSALNKIYKSIERFMIYYIYELRFKECFITVK